MKDFSQRLAKFSTIIGPVKWKALTLLMVMLFAAVSEMIGLSVIMPLLSISIEGDLGTGIGKYFSPFLSLFPDEKALMVIVTLLVALTVIKTALNILQNYLTSSFAWQLSEDWYNKIMSAYLLRPYSFILDQKQGVLLNNLIAEPASAAQSIMRILQLLSKLFLSILLYALLWISSWQVTLLLSIFGAFIFFITQGVSRRYSKSAGKRKIALLQKQNTVAAENIVAMRLIKTFSLEKASLKHFALINADLRKLRIRFAVIKAIPKPLGELLVVIGILSIFLWVSIYTQGGVKTLLPLLGMIVLTSQRLLNSVSDIISQRMNIHFLLPSLSLVHDIVHDDHDKEILEDGETFSHLQDDIILDNINYSYDREVPVFKSLNLNIPKGKTTAFVGPSGIGKSTLADLLLGLVKPSQGDILINGKPLRTYSLNSWRKRIGFVSQDTIIFNISIEENIRLGKPGASKDDVIEAAKMAVIHDFIVSLPEGYKTEVGDRGLKLSGGQRQRVAIARAMIRDPEFYIFDEATSSLDYKSEQLIKESIENIGKSKTVLIITHRLATIKDADVIYDLGKMQSACLSTHSTVK